MKKEKCHNFAVKSSKMAAMTDPPRLSGFVMTLPLKVPSGFVSLSIMRCCYFMALYPQIPTPLPFNNACQWLKQENHRGGNVHTDFAEFIQIC